MADVHIFRSKWTAYLTSGCVNCTKHKLKHEIREKKSLEHYCLNYLNYLGKNENQDTVRRWKDKKMGKKLEKYKKNEEMTKKMTRCSENLKKDQKKFIEKAQEM